MMKIRSAWNHKGSVPHFWNERTPLWSGMPRFVNFYFDLNDNKIRKFLRKQRGMILDVGCGEGRFLSYSDVGVDFSRGMVRRAKKKRKNRNLILASVLHLPFKARTFDMAFMVDVMGYIEPKQRENVWKEVRRIADVFYDFWMPHRTVFHRYFQLFKEWFKQKAIIPYCIVLAFLISFFIDRLRKLSIEPEGVSVFAIQMSNR